MNGLLWNLNQFYIQAIHHSKIFVIRRSLFLAATGQGITLKREREREKRSGIKKRFIYIYRQKKEKKGKKESGY
jgi:hypothetical protein